MKRIRLSECKHKNNRKSFYGDEEYFYYHLCDLEIGKYIIINDIHPNLEINVQNIGYSEVIVGSFMRQIINRPDNIIALINFDVYYLDKRNDGNIHLKLYPKVR
jgi:hypothetical protein